MREAEPTLSLGIRNLSQELDLTPLWEELGSKSLKGRDGESEKVSINKSKTQTYPVPKRGLQRKCIGGLREAVSTQPVDPLTSFSKEPKDTV